MEKLNGNNLWYYEGGTPNITRSAHEITTEGSLEELHQPKAGAFGASLVNDNFFSALDSVFENSLLQELKTETSRVILSLLNELESAKRKEA